LDKADVRRWWQQRRWRYIREAGVVDIVVNNAGYFPNRSIEELDLATSRKTMATNLNSHFMSAKWVPPLDEKKWGRFIGISSNMVGLAIPGMSHSSFQRWESSDS
jgi:NAD(P)-dependent dehydrogenase (short-subunit alcohol dehydrogenase family)